MRNVCVPVLISGLIQELVSGGLGGVFMEAVSFCWESRAVAGWAGGAWPTNHQKEKLGGEQTSEFSLT